MSKQKHQKLELTWIGKGEEPKLEPRILIENPEYSYGDADTQNMLIHGDNLLALKALEQDFTGKIKCIYIDPPFNTGAAFEYYDDGIEHSLWLNLMYKRFKILHSLLSSDGVIFVHLDDNEAAYCKILMDEIFGRQNYINQIINSTNKPFGFKSTATNLFKQANHIFFYAKDRTRFSLSAAKLFIEKDYDSAYNTVFENTNLNETEWTWRHINEVVANSLGFVNARVARKELGDDFEVYVAKYALENANKVFQTASVTGGAYNKRKEIVETSKTLKDKIYRHPNDDMDYMFIGGRRVIFYSERLKEIDGITLPGEILTDMWYDISIEALAKEGGIDFPKGKKPEKLIQRCIELTTKEGDYVLDSFLGSGTTSATAHKMKRKWIGIELGNQIFSHSLPRLKSVIKGEQSGISKAVNWQGGGGFKFYTLAPSLLNQDQYGNWIISKEYNPQMLAAAIVKQEGFRYQPHEHVYWKQGQSAEQDFIFITTQFLTVESLDRIHNEMQAGETLLICCKAFQQGCKNKFPQITIKKIPRMLLGRCEFGKDDYSLNIVNMPVKEVSEETAEAISVQEIADQKSKQKSKNQQSLFD